MKANKLWNNNLSSNTDARLLLTNRVKSRKAEYIFGILLPLCRGSVRLSQLKKLLSEWIKSNVPIHEATSFNIED